MTMVFQRLQTLRVRYVEAAVLGFPLVERRAADPMLAAHIGRLRPGLMLPQYPDDLLFREPARLHVHPLPGDGLYPFLEELPGLRSPAVPRFTSFDAAPTALPPIAPATI